MEYFLKSSFVPFDSYTNWIKQNAQDIDKEESLEKQEEDYQKFLESFKKDASDIKHIGVKQLSLNEPIEYNTNQVSTPNNIETSMEEFEEEAEEEEEEGEEDSDETHSDSEGLIIDRDSTPIPRRGF